VLEHLPNLGPTSARWLRDVGIETYDDLERLGSVQAFLLVDASREGVSLNLLYALEGALREVRWDRLPLEVRDALRRHVGR
jgi:TfoX/Sxy family transcriptional regulator of competence genes